MTEGVEVDGVRVGTAIVSYIEPHPGAARDFNRWYERDHFPAAVMAGPGAYSGARFVATGACKQARLGNGLFGDPQRGSYLSVAWLLPGAQLAWDAWIPGQMEALVAEGRMFAGRDHLHTAVYEFRWEVDLGDATASLALDQRYSGVIAIALGDDVRHGPLGAELRGREIPVVVELERSRLLVSTLGQPAGHMLMFAFVDGDVLDVWQRVVAPALTDRTDVGFASPFLATIPGTDAYVDKL